MKSIMWVYYAMLQLFFQIINSTRRSNYYFALYHLLNVMRLSRHVAIKILLYFKLTLAVLPGWYQATPYPLLPILHVGYQTAPTPTGRSLSPSQITPHSPHLAAPYPGSIANKCIKLGWLLQ